MVLNTFAIGQIARVDKVGRAKLARPRFLFGVYVDGDHARRLDEGGRVDAAQANAAAAKDGNRRTLCGIDARALIRRQENPKRRTDSRLLCNGAPARGDTASQQTHLVQWGLLIDGNNRDVCHDCILRECRHSHLMRRQSLVYRLWNK